MRALIRFLLRRGSVLVGFLVVKAAISVIKGATLDPSEAWGLGILALAVYAVIAWFAHQGRAVSIWAISILMLYEAAGLLLASLPAFPAAPLATLLGLATAAYLILGALIVFSSRHARS